MSGVIGWKKDTTPIITKGERGRAREALVFTLTTHVHAQKVSERQNATVMGRCSPMYWWTNSRRLQTAIWQRAKRRANRNCRITG